MRLPWLQIDADGMTRGEMLGRLLATGPDAGIGMTMRLWRWALEMSPDGDFSGGAHEPRVVAAAIGWSEDVERLVLELAVVGLIERIRDAGPMPVSAGLVRIRGLDRYKRAWEKNQKRRPAPKAPVTGTSRAGLAPEPARKTETDTFKDFPPQNGGPPKKPRKPSRQESLFAEAQKLRCAKHPMLQPEAIKDVVVLNSGLKDPLDRVGAAGMLAAFGAYLEDPYARDRGWPWGLFFSDWPRHHAMSLRVAAGPPKQLEPQCRSPEESRKYLSEMFGAAT